MKTSPLNIYRTLIKEYLYFNIPLPDRIFPYMLRVDNEWKTVENNPLAPNSPQPLTCGLLAAHMITGQVKGEAVAMTYPSGDRIRHLHIILPCYDPSSDCDIINAVEAMGFLAFKQAGSVHGLKFLSSSVSRSDTIPEIQQLSSIFGDFRSNSVDVVDGHIVWPGDFKQTILPYCINSHLSTLESAGASFESLHSTLFCSSSISSLLDNAPISSSTIDESIIDSTPDFIASNNSPSISSSALNDPRLFNENPKAYSYIGYYGQSGKRSKIEALEDTLVLMDRMDDILRELFHQPVTQLEKTIEIGDGFTLPVLPIIPVGEFKNEVINNHIMPLGLLEKDIQHWTYSVTPEDATEEELASRLSFITKRVELLKDYRDEAIVTEALAASLWAKAVEMVPESPKLRGEALRATRRYTASILFLFYLRARLGEMETIMTAEQAIRLSGYKLENQEKTENAMRKKMGRIFTYLEAAGYITQQETRLINKEQYKTQKWGMNVYTIEEPILEMARQDRKERDRLNIVEADMAYSEIMSSEQLDSTQDLRPLSSPLKEDNSQYSIENKEVNVDIPDTTLARNYCQGSSIWYCLQSDTKEEKHDLEDNNLQNINNIVTLEDFKPPPAFTCVC